MLHRTCLCSTRQRHKLKAENMTLGERAKYGKAITQKPGVRPLSRMHPDHPIRRADCLIDSRPGQAFAP